MRQTQSKIKVAIGPARNYPSWNWIGSDTAKELSKYFDVQIFEEGQIPAADATLFVKRCPAEKYLKFNGSKVIYIPVDFYDSEASVERSAGFLKNCAAVLIHSERLRTYLEPWNANVWSIDHHLKYSLNTESIYRNEGFGLWIGGFQYLPYFLKWVETYRPPLEFKILTDYVKGGERATLAANTLANRLGINLSIQSEKMNGIPYYEWNEKFQKELMTQAKAAIDIKGGREDFQQFTKPPTKAQKFISSGIPFATNRENYAWDYFSPRDFMLSESHDFERWLSKEYWEAVQVQRSLLQESLSLESVGKIFRDYIVKVL